MILVSCEYIRVENLNLSHTTTGLHLLNTNNTIIFGNNITANKRYGIELSLSSNNTLFGNNVTANNADGIYLSGSFNNTLSGNKIANNYAGMHLIGSSNNSIIGNAMPANGADGINLEYSSNSNSIFGNNVSNSRFGILLEYSCNYNIVSENNATSNNWYGIGLYSSSNNNTVSKNIMIANGDACLALSESSENKIYHNNFISNADQVQISPGYANVWDDGYPSGGNYWSDYTGIDANSDGIGDSPYIINDNNRDRYPLVNNWTPSNHVPPVTPNVQVGVKSGDWIKVDYTVTGAPSGTTLPLWLKVEFLSVEGTNATARVTMRMSDGTEQNATVPVDVVTGGQALGLSGFVIPANATSGDSVYMSGYGNVTVAGETTRSYAGASRTVVYASFSQYGTQLTYYWDKQTGVLVEATIVSGSMTATGKTTETNMWQAGPSGLPIEPIYLYILATLAIIVAVGVATFFIIMRRKRKPPEEAENPQSELRLTRARFRRSFGHRITRARASRIPWHITIHRRSKARSTRYLQTNLGTGMRAISLRRAHALIRL